MSDVSVIRKRGPGRTPGSGRKRYKPSDEDRVKCTAYATVGTPHKDIAVLLDVSIKTLLKYFRKELDYGKAQGNAQMGGRLFKAGMQGSVAAQIFWMKSQAGWREKEPTEPPPSGDLDAPPPIEAAELPADYTEEAALQAYLRLTQD